MMIVMSSIGLVLFLVLSIHIFTSAAEEQEEIKTKDIKLSAPGKNLDATQLWKSQMEAREKLRDQKIDLLSSMVSKQAMEPKQTHEVENLRAELQSMRQELESRKHHEGQWEGERHPLSPTRNAGIKKVVVNLENKNTRHISRFVPAGAFVPAVLLSSVDANCGVTATSDPKPVSLRLLDEGSLPNNFKSRLKRCVVVGAAHGDISSERVYIRLERMSCIDKKTEEVIETEVAGYVSGEDGKAGVRGEVVDRSGSMVARAAIGGFLGGVSQFMQGGLATQQLSNLAEKTGGNTLFNVDNMKDAGSKGVGAAMDKLSEYYIKRAEQLQPVLQVAAGRTVDVVFIKGVSLGSKGVQNSIKKDSEGGSSW